MNTQVKSIKQKPAWKEIAIIIMRQQLKRRHEAVFIPINWSSPWALECRDNDYTRFCPKLSLSDMFPLTSKCSGIWTKSSSYAIYAHMVIEAASPKQQWGKSKLSCMNHSFMMLIWLILPSDHISLSPALLHQWSILTGILLHFPHCFTGLNQLFTANKLNITSLMHY